MSYLSRLSLESSLTWAQTQIINNVYTIEQGELSVDDGYASGTGVGQLNKGYVTASGLNSGENKRIDLFNLNRVFFGITANINYSGDNVKLLYIKNTSTGVGEDLFICGTGSGGFTHLLGYGYLGQIIKPNTYSIFYDKNYGFQVNTNNRYLYLYDISGRAVDYELGIFGVSFD